MKRIIGLCLVFLFGYLAPFMVAHAGDDPRYRRVNPGEYLSQIAVEFPYTNWREIAKLNNIKSPYIIKPEQMLRIPENNAHIAKAEKRLQTAIKIEARMPTTDVPAWKNASLITEEVIKTSQGYAHVFDGRVPNLIAPKRAIDTLFADASSETRAKLFDQVSANTMTPIVVRVGDRMQRMLTSEGTLYENVLQAQIWDTILLAKCYVLNRATPEPNLILIREMRSGNWYGEFLLPQEKSADDCLRDRRHQPSG